MRNRYWALLWLTLPFSALSETWRLNVTAKPVEGSSNDYEYSVKVADWDFSEQTRNPLYQCVDKQIGVCQYAIGYFSSVSSNTGITGSEQVRQAHASSAKTIGELGYNIMTTDSSWWNRTFTLRSNNKQMCFFVSYSIQSSGHTMLPGGTCTYADLPPAVCHIKEPYIEILHQVNKEQSSGLIATGQITVSCTENMKVRIVGKYRSDYIMLDKAHDFKSMIVINDTVLSYGTVITATPDGTTVNIKSRLYGSAPPGEYQGSAVIIVAPE
ncbi:hypothetical protein AB6H27_12900 [Providencia huaxiensis]|uniref:MrpH family fimbial adhesin n=1 Tax=Providencia TaxID=586 RepID=UPI000ED1B3BD|nr:MULTISPECIES: hypothetical protein [Providencia]HCI96611.1 hypothetical protein [Providencia sp.]ELR5057819.1 hypothetical protein [Providencia rettgeri]ELR5087416.1 hypothetical protein [Providencia rettgeri]ELR5109858.1 hypothetical protein [Providencia rettgeri]ELR5284673.1 hypothetical protein [Providencia rettgeri]